MRKILLFAISLLFSIAALPSLAAPIDIYHGIRNQLDEYQSLMASQTSSDGSVIRPIYTDIVWLQDPSLTKISDSTSRAPFNFWTATLEILNKTGLKGGVDLFVAFIDDISYTRANYAGLAMFWGSILEKGWALHPQRGVTLIAHEIGHSLGLGHVSSYDNIMFTTLNASRVFTPDQVDRMIRYSSWTQPESDGSNIYTFTFTPIIISSEPDPRPSPVPLPSAGLLLAASLASLGFSARGRAIAARHS